MEQSSSSCGMQQAVSSFGMTALTADLNATDEALKALSKDILAYQNQRDADDAAWLEAEAEWLEELRHLREAAGGEDMDSVAAEKQYWTTSREYRSVVYGGCCSYDDSDEDISTTDASGSPASGKMKSKKPSIVEAILEQRRFKGDLYYRVKWAGVDVISWEDANELKAIGALRNAVRAMVESNQQRTSKLRPAIYFHLSKKEQRRLDKAGGTSEMGSVYAHRPDARYAGVWTCEVENSLWIPYDSAVNNIIDKAYCSSLATATFNINGRQYSINFNLMKQHGGAERRVRRLEHIPDHVLRAQINDMSLQQLRDYLSTVVDFTEVHYEALIRLHEEDKVRTHLSRDELSNLETKKFSELKKESAAGSSSTPLFSTECAICLDEYHDDDEVTRMSICGHVFHKGCASNYFSRFSKLCPYCKEDAA